MKCHWYAIIDVTLMKIVYLVTPFGYEQDISTLIILGKSSSDMSFHHLYEITYSITNA